MESVIKSGVQDAKGVTSRLPSKECSVSTS